MPMANVIMDPNGTSSHITKHVKRNYDTWCQCPICKDFKLLSDKSVGYGCCGQYHSVSDTKVDDSQVIPKDGSVPHFLTDEAKNYVKFRDEMQLRSDLYVKGITRDRVGPQKFKRILKKQLVENKCYRGKQSHVD